MVAFHAVVKDEAGDDEDGDGTAADDGDNCAFREWTRAWLAWFL